VLNILVLIYDNIKNNKAAIHFVNQNESFYDVVGNNYLYHAIEAACQDHKQSAAQFMKQLTA